jgi:PilZ domain-containing protein
MLGGVKNDPAKLRCAVRFPLHLPVAVMGNEGADDGVTEDISAAGILMHCRHDYPVGSTIQFSIRMPARALGAERDVQVQCTGRVVRCTPVGNRNAVGAIIDEYRVAH